jgi:hypothetical protein
MHEHCRSFYIQVVANPNQSVLVFCGTKAQTTGLAEQLSKKLNPEVLEVMVFAYAAVVALTAC